MSVLTDVYPSSSRFHAVVKYLLSKPSKKEVRTKLELLLSPESLVKTEGGQVERKMIRGVLKEGIKMNLLIEGEKNRKKYLGLADDIKSLDLLPFYLAQLLITNEAGRDEKLAIVIAWYLAQDAYNAPSNWDELESDLQKQVGSSKLEMNNARYTQFLDWICYLGFAWKYGFKNDSRGKKRSFLTPDPTAYLRSALPFLIQEPEVSISIDKFISKLGKLCPVFETGEFRKKVENQKVPGRDFDQYLSSTTSLALFRLKDEKTLRLEKKSDATKVFSLPEGDGFLRFTHIARLK